MKRVAIQKGKTVSGMLFFIFLYFVLDFFLHFPNRINGYGLIRPTMIAAILIFILLFSHAGILKEKFQGDVFKAMGILLLYIFISSPLVEYAGSFYRSFLVGFIKAIVFFYFTALIIDTYKRQIIFITFFVGIQTFRVLEPLYLNITDGYWGDRTFISGGEFANRLAGAPADIINPNELGFIIVTIIPFLHYLMLKRGFMIKLLYFILLPCLLYALLLTMSRGAMVVLLVGAWIILKNTKYKLPFILLGAVLTIVGWSTLDNFTKDRYLSIFGAGKIEQNTKTSEGRINGLLGEFQLGMSRPIVGHGVGTTREAKYNLTGRSQASHNMYGELVIEIGLVGLFFFIKFILAIKKELGRFKVIETEDPQLLYHQDINKICKIVLVMYAIYSLNYYGLSQYYWYLLAALVVVNNRLMVNRMNTLGTHPHLLKESA
jgi:putative inorganic carbon (HCO3(-)) transporter